MFADAVGAVLAQLLLVLLTRADAVGAVLTQLLLVLLTCAVSVQLLVHDSALYADSACFVCRFLLLYVHVFVDFPYFSAHTLFNINIEDLCLANADPYLKTV